MSERGAVAVRREPSWAALGALLAVLVAGGSLTAWVANQRADIAVNREKAETNRQSVEAVRQQLMGMQQMLEARFDRLDQKLDRNAERGR